MSDMLDQSVTFAGTGRRPATLEYAPRLAWHEQRRWRSVAWRMSLSFLIVAVAAGAVRPVKHRLRLLSLERQCRTTPTTQGVLFCNRLDGGRVVSPTNASAIREFGEATDRYAFLFRGATTVFAQAMCSADGEERTILASVYVSSDHGCMGPARNTVYVLDFQSVPTLSMIGGFEPRKVKQAAFVYRVPLAEAGLRIHSPTIDPLDPARLTLNFDTNSGSLAIHARLENDGILTFNLRGLDPERWYVTR